MARAARGLSGELRGRIDVAAEGSRWSLVVVAVLAVGREGLETALFLWAATQAGTRDVVGAATPTWQPLLGAALGILTAVALGYLIYRGALSINLSRFFTWTGAFLIVVAAGVLAYGVHDLQEARFLPGARRPRLRRVRLSRHEHLVRRPAQGHLQLLAGHHQARGCRLAALRRAGDGPLPGRRPPTLLHPGRAVACGCLRKKHLPMRKTFVAALVALPLLAACTQNADTGSAGGSGDAADARALTVDSSADACTLSATEAPAGNADLRRHQHR